MALLYVGCSLTQATAEFRAFVIHLQGELKKEHELLEFVGLTAGNEAGVYTHDISCVDKADLMIALCDQPSIGLGMEIQRRIDNNRPVLLLAHDKSHVTRMVPGAAKVVDSVYFERYGDLEDLLGTVNQMISGLCARKA